MEAGGGGGVGGDGRWLLDGVVHRAQQMFNQAIGRCGKRPRVFADDDRPLKRRRLNADGDAVDAEFFPVINDVVMGDAAGSGVLSQHNGRFVVTVAESSGFGALADWEVFYDVLLAEEFGVLDPDAGFVGLAQNNPEVAISKQVFVRDIVKMLHLRLHAYKVVLEETGLYRASIEIDLPHTASRRYRKRKKFYGFDENSKYAAMESACETALSHLMVECHVVVKDLSSVKVDLLEKKCAAAETFNKQFMEMIKLSDSKSLKVQIGLSDAISMAELMCKKFIEVVPLKFGGTDEAVQQGSEMVVYDGMNPPVSAIDKLAFAFASLMDGVTNVIRMNLK